MRASLMSIIKGKNRVEVSDLTKRVMCSLFLDFLKSENFSYTPTVFVPECGRGDKMLSRQEIRESLRIPELEEKSVLETIVEKVKKIYERPHLCETYSQTEDSPATGLESRLMQLDNEFLTKTRGNAPENLEERMARYKKECDDRMRLELNSEILRIREVEMISK